MNCIEMVNFEVLLNGISRERLVLSHLFSIDENVFFFKDLMQECLAIKEIMQDYKKGSGQTINKNKNQVGTLIQSKSKRSMLVI